MPRDLRKRKRKDSRPPWNRRKKTDASQQRADAAPQVAPRRRLWGKGPAGAAPALAGAHSASAVEGGAAVSALVGRRPGSAVHTVCAIDSGIPPFCVQLRQAEVQLRADGTENAGLARARSIAVAFRGHEAPSPPPFEWPGVDWVTEDVDYSSGPPCVCPRPLSECAIRLPHVSPELGFTTTLEVGRPLHGLLRRAAEIAEERRRQSAAFRQSLSPFDDQLFLLEKRAIRESVERSHGWIAFFLSGRQRAPRPPQWPTRAIAYRGSHASAPASGREAR